MTAPLRMSFDVACSAGHAFRFLAQGTEATRVEIEHRGWERLSPQTARPWRDRNQANWQTLLPHFIEAITQGED
jgi:hypothetical protein